jgi:hypothetical protein
VEEESIAFSEELAAFRQLVALLVFSFSIRLELYHLEMMQVVWLFVHDSTPVFYHDDLPKLANWVRNFYFFPLFLDH